MELMKGDLGSNGGSAAGSRTNVPKKESEVQTDKSYTSQRKKDKDKDKDADKDADKE